MIKRFIKKAIIKAIKKRVLKKAYAMGDYKDATSFIVNAPIKEWRSRLWFIENISDESGFRCTDERVYQWLSHH